MGTGSQDNEGFVDEVTVETESTETRRKRKGPNIYIFMNSGHNFSVFLLSSTIIKGNLFYFYFGVVVK
jgi:hypothetical protein